MGLPRFVVAETLSGHAVALNKFVYFDRPWAFNFPVRRACWPGCPTGTTCANDIYYGAAWNAAMCCPTGQIACNGQCRPACPGAQRMEGVNCTCECPYSNPPLQCLGGAVRNPITCLCECPTTPCPDYRMVRNPGSCTCECPSGLTDCYGYCADLNTSPWFCGSCNAVPCDSFTEECCNGSCKNICSPSDCGSCGRAIQAGEKCCNCKSTMLGTNQNCSDCGDLCSGGRTCINGTCQCPAGTRQCTPSQPCCPNSRQCCANGYCCPTGTECCNGVCVNTKTSPAHCGGCNKPCPQGGSCNNGQCQCPANNVACGAPPGACMNNMNHPVGAGWAAWRQAHPGVPIFTCPNGVFTCNRAAGILTVAGGACCPPGFPVSLGDKCCTQIVNGQCL